MTDGIVIVGGRSSRFGPGEKALADVSDTPTVRRVVDSLVPLVDRVVNVRPV